MGSRSKGGYKLPQNARTAFTVAANRKPRPPRALVVRRKAVGANKYRRKGRKSKRQL